MTLTAAVASADRLPARQAAWRYANTCSPERRAARIAALGQERPWGRTGTQTQLDADALDRTQTQRYADLPTQTQPTPDATDATLTQQHFGAPRQNRRYAAHRDQGQMAQYRRELAWQENDSGGRALRSRNRELWKISTRLSTRFDLTLTRGLPSGLTRVRFAFLLDP